MKIGLAPVQSRNDFDAMIAQAVLAESLGYDALWAHEHHSQGMMYPDPLMTLSVLASATGRIALGTNMLLLPIHHPVRVAQQAAMLDVQSHGRLRLGVANGYSPLDLATFGVPRSQRAKRLDAGLRLIRELWSGEPVSATGDGFSLDEFVLFPRPVQRPMPEILVGGQARVAVERAVRLGDGYLISTTESVERVGELVATYHAALSAFDRPARRPILNRIVCVVDDASARAHALEFFSEALLALYDAWGHANIVAMDERARSPEALARTHLIVGEASECVERILTYEEQGIGELSCLMNFGGPDLEWAERSIRLMGERVLPRL